MFAGLNEFIHGAALFQKSAEESVLSDTGQRTAKFGLKNNQEGHDSDREEFSQYPVDGIELEKFGDIKNHGEDDKPHQNLHGTRAFEKANEIIKKRPNKSDFGYRFY